MDLTYTVSVGINRPEMGNGMSQGTHGLHHEKSLYQMHMFELCFKEVFESIKLFLKHKGLFIRTFCLSYLPCTLNSQILQLRAQKELVHLLENLDFKMYFLTEYYH